MSLGGGIVSASGVGAGLLVPVGASLICAPAVVARRTKSEAAKCSERRANIMGAAVARAAAHVQSRKIAPEGLFRDHPPPKTFTVKATMPRLNTKAARQWNVTTRRSRPDVIVMSETWNVMPRHVEK